MSSDVFLGSVYASIEIKDSELNKSIERAKSKFNNLDKTMSDTANNGQKSVNNMSSAFDNLSNALGSIDSGLSKITGGLLAAGSAAVGLGVKGGFKLAEQIEDAETGLSFMLKSREKAAAAMARVREEAIRTPFDVGNLSKMTQQMTTFTKDANKSIDVIMAMGSATVASGRGIEELQNATINLGQAFNNAWTYGDYTQMLNAVPMFKTISDEYGLTWEKMQAIQKSGTQNLGEELTKVFNDWGKKNDVFKETQQNLSQLKASFQEVFVTMFYDSLKASGAIGIFKDIIVKTKDTLENNKGLLVDSFKKIGEVAKQIDFAALFQGLVSVVKVGVEFIGLMADGFTKVSKLVGGGDMTKGIDRIAKGLIYATVAVKGLRIALPVLKMFDSGIGNLGSKLGLFKGAGKGAEGAGNVVAGILKPLGDNQVLKGAASVALIGGGLLLLGKAIDTISKAEIDLLALGTTLLGVRIIAQIFGTISESTSLKAGMSGAAIGVIGVGLTLISKGMATASKTAKDIDIMNLGKMVGATAVIAGILGAMMKFTIFAAVGSIATAVMSGGLLVTAMGLKETSKIASEINKQQLVKFSVTVGIVSGILGALMKFSMFAAISSILTAVMSGGLYVAATGLKEASKHATEIDEKGLAKLLKNVGITSSILTALSAFSAFGSIGSVASAVIGKGLEVASDGLKKASANGSLIDEAGLDILNGAITKTSAILSLISGMSVFGAVTSVASDIIGKGLLGAAKSLVEASKIAPEINKDGVEKLKRVVTSIANLNQNGVLDALDKMFASNVLAKVAENIVSISKTLTGVTAPNEKAVESLKNVVTKVANLNQNGTLDSLDKMLSSNMLAKVAENIVEVNKKLSGVKPVDETAVQSLQDVMTKISNTNMANTWESLDKMWSSGNLFNVVDNMNKISHKISEMKKVDHSVINNVRDGIYRISIVNIDGGAFGEDKVGKAEKLAKVVDSVKNIADKLKAMPAIGDAQYNSFAKVFETLKLFDRVTPEMETGAKRLSGLSTAIGNLDWIKHIFGNVPEDLYTKGVRLIDSVKLFDRITDAQLNGALKLNSINGALSNLDWIKHIFGDVPEDLHAKAQRLVSSINELGNINLDVAKLTSLGKGLVANVVSGITASLGAVSQAGADVQGSFWRAIEGKMQDEYHQGAAMASRFAKGLGSSQAQIEQAGRNAQGAYWRAIEGKMQDEYWQGMTMANKFAQGLSDGAKNTTQSGVWAVRGFINGANSMDPYSTGWRIADRFLQGLKARGKEGSPWRQTIQSGKWAGEGLAIGIKKSTQGVVNASQRLADAVLNNTHISELNELFSPNTANIQRLNNAFSSKATPAEQGSQVSIYGNITINAKDADGDGILDELSRATALSSRGMATAI